MSVSVLYLGIFCHHLALLVAVWKGGEFILSVGSPGNTMCLQVYVTVQRRWDKSNTLSDSPPPPEV